MSELKERLRNAIECVGELVPGQPNDPEDALAEIERLEREVERLRGAIETLVAGEVISASRARELHEMTPGQQREHWRQRIPRGKQEIENSC